jgi:integrase
VLVRAVRGGRIEIETFRKRVWKPALVAAGLRHPRIYDLRNSFISWHLMRGTPISTVATWAGTSAREIEDTYKRYITEDAYASAIDDLTPAAFQSFGH